MPTLKDLIKPADFVAGNRSVVAYLERELPELVPEGLPSVHGRELRDMCIAGEPSFLDCLNARWVLCPILRRTQADGRAGRAALDPDRLPEIGGDGFGLYLYRRVAWRRSVDDATLVVSASREARRKYKASFEPSVPVLSHVEHEDDVRGHHVLGEIPPWLAAQAASVSMRRNSADESRAVITAQVFELDRVSREEAGSAAFWLRPGRPFGIGGNA